MTRADDPHIKLLPADSGPVPFHSWSSSIGVTSMGESERVAFAVGGGGGGGGGGRFKEEVVLYGSCTHGLSLIGFGI